MEPDRFDDVSARILEDSPPPSRPPRRRRRWLLATVISLLAAGGLAAGASALTSGSAPAAPAAPAKAEPVISHTASGVPVAHDGATCHAGRGRQESTQDLTSAPRD